MTVYLFAYLIIFILALHSNQINKKQAKYLLAIWSIYIALICGLRDMLGGYDSYIYAEVFDVTSNQIDNNIPAISTLAIKLNEKELGFAFFNVFVSYITANRYVFLFIISLFIFASKYYHINKYSNHPIVAFFILFCMLYFFSFTYLRQLMAACIAWYSIPYAVKRRPIPFFLIILLATSFHNSAALFGITYFIATKRFSKKQILIFVSISIIAGFTPLGSFLFELLGGAINEEKASSAITHAASARFEYILEAMFFFVIIFKNYDYIAEDKLSTCMLNIALLFMFVLTFFVRFRDGGRMSWYFVIGIATTIAQVAEHDGNRGLFKFAILSTATLLYFRVLVMWGGIISPYKTFLTNGVRNGDTTSQQYEYDHSYDKDKFYRPIFKPIS